MKIIDQYFHSDLVLEWITNCLQSINQKQHVVAAMKLLWRICYLFAVKAAASNDHYHRSEEFTQLVLLKYKEIYQSLQDELQLFDKIVDELLEYMDSVRSLIRNGVRIAEQNHEEQVIFSPCTSIK